MMGMVLLAWSKSVILIGTIVLYTGHGPILCADCRVYADPCRHLFFCKSTKVIKTVSSTSGWICLFFFYSVKLEFSNSVLLYHVYINAFCFSQGCKWWKWTRENFLHVTENPWWNWEGRWHWITKGLGKTQILFLFFRFYSINLYFAIIDPICCPPESDNT